MARNTRELIAPTTTAAVTSNHDATFGFPEGGMISVHVALSAAGSVQMQGRNNPAHPWSPIGAALTASAIVLLPMAAHVRAVLSGNTGTASVSICY
jgi:hypothetical protein